MADAIMFGEIIVLELEIGTPNQYIDTALVKEFQSNFRWSFKGSKHDL